MGTTPRTTRPRRWLAASALAGVLLAAGACGAEEDPTDEPTNDPTRTASSSPLEPSGAPSSSPPAAPATSPGGDGVPHTEVALVTGLVPEPPETGVPTVLDTPEARERWLAQFRSSGIAADLQEVLDAATDGRSAQGDGRTLLGVTLHVGCEQPEDYRVERVDGDLRVLAEGPKETVQCVTALTTVALLAVDASVL